MSIVNFISQKIDFDATVEKYLILSNVDLTCDLLKISNLRGKVGGYYASKENFLMKYRCFFFYYNLTFEKQHNNILSHVLSISQKIDSIIGFLFPTKNFWCRGPLWG